MANSELTTTNTGREPKDGWIRWFSRPGWLGLLLFAGVLVVYIRTLAPGALGGDPGELQFVPDILSMPHPTGTPLYVLLGKVWGELPLGSTVAVRMNLLAAMSASLAVLVVYHTVHLLVERLVPALAAALALAFGLTFWEQALIADKYAFNALMVALLLYLAIHWGQNRAPATLNLLAITFGLSLAHHRTTILFALPLLGYVWWYEKAALWRDWRRLLRLASLCLAPLLLYLYLPWASARGLPPGTWQPRSLADWYHYFFDTGQVGYVYVDLADLGERLSFYARTLRGDFSLVGILPGLVGLMWQGWRRKPEAVFLGTSFLLQAFLAANHHVPRHWVYFLPSFLIFTLWLGEGLGLLWLGVDWVRSRWAAAGVVVATAVVMLSLPLVGFGEHYRPLRQTHLGAGALDVWRQTLKTGHMADRLGAAITDVAPDAVIIADWEQATPLWYYQQVEGLRPDVQIVYPVERLEEWAAEGRPLYVARNLAGLAGRWHPSSAGPLIALRTESTPDLPVDIIHLGIQVGGSFELAGYLQAEVKRYPGTVVPLTLFWRALSPPEHDYSVSLRLYNAAGQEVTSVDSQHPVLGTYPTSYWSRGEVVGDYYEIELPPGLPPGTYRWGAILYRSLPDGGWENLTVKGTDGVVALGGTIEIGQR